MRLGSSVRFGHCHIDRRLNNKQKEFNLLDNVVFADGDDGLVDAFQL